jgi:hypothetical protein
MKEMLNFFSNVLGCPIEGALSPEFGLVQSRAGTALIDRGRRQQTRKTRRWTTNKGQ